MRCYLSGEASLQKPDHVDEPQRGPHNVSALIAQTAMDNALAVYEEVENCAAVVHTHKADSMQPSESLFERQLPRVAFNLFFRKPDEHAAQEIGNFRRGIFQIESTLGHLKRLEIQLQGRKFRLGHRCHVLEITTPDKPGDKAQL